MLHMPSHTFDDLVMRSNVTSKQRTKHPQDCPQSKLQLEYANKKIKFEDLKYNQFVADSIRTTCV
jgi:hypothetical protein